MKTELLTAAKLQNESTVNVLDTVFRSAEHILILIKIVLYYYYSFRCGVGNTRIHRVCLRSDEADQAGVTVGGESAFKCDALAKLLGSTPTEPPSSLFYE